MAAMQFAFFSTLNVSSASICTVLFFLAAYLLALSSSECQGIGWGARALPKVRFKCGLSHPPPLALSLALSLSFSSRHPLLRNSYVIKLEHCLSLVPPPFFSFRSPPLEASEGTHNLFSHF
jgi:hypothetical protein